MLSPVPVVLALLASAAYAQFVEPPKDLKTVKGYAGVNIRYKQVPPGICELDPTVKSYAGYADVGKDQHIFFWFFEARKGDPKKAPLTSWINGGPGSSSMIGLFSEHGPCTVDSKGKVRNNPYSWNTHSNMIYIDQPQTVGFSYTKAVKAFYDSGSGETTPINGTGCAGADGRLCGTYSVPDETLVPDTTEGAAPNFYRTLQGFMGAFPQYSRNGFHFASESYGGHYGPVFSEYIEEQNRKKVPGAHEVHLESLFVGNGWYDPIVQYQAYYRFITGGNTYDYDPYNSTIKKQIYNDLYGKGKCIDQLKKCAKTGDNKICSDGDNFCATNIEFPYDDILNRDEYDVRELTPDPFPYEFYSDYLQTPKLQKAIGAFVNFSSYSGTVGDAFGTTGDDGRESGTIEDIQKLLKQGVAVTLFAGDADYNCNWLGGETVAEEVKAPGFSSAGYADLQTSDGICHGVVKQAGAFSFVRVYNAGHLVPFYQPLAALELFDRAISGVDIATGRKKNANGYRTKGPKKSLFREGIKTVQFEVLPEDATYNTTLNGPNPYKKGGKRSSVSRRGLRG